MDKRKQLIVNPKVQLKFIGMLVSVAVLPIIVLFISFTLYIGSVLERIPADNESLMRLVESVQILNIMTFSGFVLILIVLAFVETKFLHRIVGPLYRIETDLEEVLKTNDFKRKIVIRKKDYLHSLVEKVNRLLEKCAKA